MIPRGLWKVRAAWAAACLVGWSGALAPARSATVDFESPAYIHDRTVDGVDGWTRSSHLGGLPENFRVFAENGTQGGNRWMRVWTDGFNTLYKDLPGQAGLLDLQWRWRVSDSGADVCLGVSSANDNARGANRALVCFHPQGRIAVAKGLVDTLSVAGATWTPGAVHHMRMRLDHAQNSYSVYMASDSLRGDEKLLAGPLGMAGLATAAFTRVVVRTENGIGTADVDDIAWETVAAWKGTADTLASNGKNWSTGSVPDSNVQVALGALAEGNLFLDKPLAVRSITVEKGFAHSLNLGSNLLTAHGKADFTGLKAHAATTGAVRFASNRAQTLTGPEAASGPAIVHDGPGLLRLDARNFFGRSLTQTAGTLDLNKFDITLEGDLAILNGGPSSVRNLDGRNLAVGRSARFEGTAASLLALRGASQSWHISASDTLLARYAEIQGSVSGGRARGFAFQSVDKGGNEGWTFGAPPVILAQPAAYSTMVGLPVTLKVSASGGGLPLSFQWLRAGQPLPGKTDSVLSLAKAALADSGSYACQVANAVATVTSAAARLTVAFPAPVAQPGSTVSATPFTDSLTVRLSAHLAGATVLVSRNGGPYQVLQGDLILRETTTLKAVAALGPDTSAAGAWTYARVSPAILEKPLATPPGGAFGDSVQVALAAPAGAPNAVVWYKVDGGPLNLYNAAFTLRQSATVKAIAILGSTLSDTATWTFTKRLEAPVASPRGRGFPDTLRVSLAPKAPGAEVHYTLDGRTPDTTSPRYSGPLLLDSTVVLKAVTVKAGMAASEVLTETYELVPDSLKAMPRGGDFAEGLFIQLQSTSARASIWYTLDGSVPGPENPASLRYAGGIRLDTNAVLKAAAVAGQGPTLRKGPAIAERYTFITPGTRTLGPGQTVEISSRYSISNPFPGAPPVQVEVIEADSLKEARGFRDVQFGIRVTLPPEAPGFPEIRFAAPKGEERALYDLSPGGAMRFISDADTVALPGTGTYFLGVDTVPPRIVLSGETFAGEGTKLVFSIQDNVSSLVMDLERSDDPSRNVVARRLDNPDVVSETLQSPAIWSPLWIKLRVSDRRNVRHFPADTAAEYQVARKTASPLRSPAVFRVGTQADRPWDMVSIPLEIEGRLTLGRFRELNPVKGLSVKAWDAVNEKFRDIGDGEALEPGQAMWMGSPSSFSSVSLPAFQTAGRKGQEAYKVKLRKGWNQVANPSLRPLIWPFSRKGPDYAGSLVKGLHGYDPELPGGGYFEADTLLPWKGYFVLYKGSQDTLITLRAAPVPEAPAKRGAPAPGAGLPALVLGLDRLPALRLGALPQAADGLGVEDEPQPPSQGGHGPELHSVRERARLGTDFLRWTPGAVLAWKVVASGNRNATSEEGRSARVEAADLPPGYAAYAVSRVRGLKFRLAAGGGFSLPPAGPDSLDIYAGPAEVLARRLAPIPGAVEAFRLEALPRPGGYALRLDLPHAAALRFSLWSLDGRSLDRGGLDLAPGRYDLARRVRNGALPPGLALLKVEWSGGGKSGRLTRKLSLP